MGMDFLTAPSNVCTHVINHSAESSFPSNIKRKLRGPFEMSPTTMVSKLPTFSYVSVAPRCKADLQLSNVFLPQGSPSVRELYASALMHHGLHISLQAIKKLCLNKRLIFFILVTQECNRSDNSMRHLKDTKRRVCRIYVRQPF